MPCRYSSLTAYLLNVRYLDSGLRAANPNTRNVANEQFPHLIGSLQCGGIGEQLQESYRLLPDLPFCQFIIGESGNETSAGGAGPTNARAQALVGPAMQLRIDTRVCTRLHAELWLIGKGHVIIIYAHCI